MKSVKCFTVIVSVWFVLFVVCGCTDTTELSTAQLYQNAVNDAAVAEENEILPLVCISKDDKNVIWNEAGDKVLIVFSHKYPDSYPAGEDLELKWSPVWCVSAGELYEKIKAENGKVTNWALRLNQLLGLPEASGRDTVTAMWVDPAKLYRPANCVDATINKMTTKLTKTGDEAFDAMYENWYNAQIIGSYYSDAYPWTRLGYTYDWSDNGTEYALTEFLIFANCEGIENMVGKVEYTLSVIDFIYYVTGNK